MRSRHAVAPRARPRPQPATRHAADEPSSDRFAPDRTPAEAEAHIREVLGHAHSFEIADSAPPAAPSLNHPLLGALLEATGTPPVAKLGWTDVSRFAARGIPATNFGPGDPNLAHHAEERVSRHDLETCYSVLKNLLGHADATTD